MATVIQARPREGRGEWLPRQLDSALPSRLLQELLALSSRVGPPEELRLRADKSVSVSRKEGNLFLQTILSREEMETILLSLCDGSLYAHRESIAKGFLSLANGIRVGVVGRAVVEADQVIGVYEVTGLNVRFPRRLPPMGGVVAELLRRQEEGRGVLLYAPPGGGKTTVLRSVAAMMGSGSAPLRVCLVDTREELFFSLEEKRLCVDVLRGYPRAVGIEIATRTMNAQLIVCDEIGGTEEAEAIRAAQNSGVPLLASAHGSSVEGLLRREGLMLLHRSRVFGAYVGVERGRDGGEPRYQITSWEEADEYVENYGRSAIGR